MFDTHRSTRGVTCTVTLLFVSVALLAASCFAASPLEVLYVAERQSETVTLLTYNVNPQTAVATQVGSMAVPSSSINPLTVGGKHFLYVWNGSSVWVYPTGFDGAPQAQPTQQLNFNFAHPVYSFLVDPDGKFAYAAVLWRDSHGYSDAAITLFTIDATSGKLTRAHRVVATYSDYYTYLIGFNFGVSGHRLFAKSFDDGPYTCMPGYDFYSVNQTTGTLGPLTTLIQEGADCGGTATVAVSDTLTAGQSTCCSAGSGYLTITNVFTNRQISCQAPTFCGDDAGMLVFDPASKNIVYPDFDVNKTFIGHLDFENLQLIQGPSTIPGTPHVYFSPDSLMLYAQTPSWIAAYAFDSSTGNLLVHKGFAVKGKVTIAPATFYQ